MSENDLGTVVPKALRFYLTKKYGWPGAVQPLSSLVESAVYSFAIALTCPVFVYGMSSGGCTFPISFTDNVCWNIAVVRWKLLLSFRQFHRMTYQEHIVDESICPYGREPLNGFRSSMGCLLHAVSRATHRYNSPAWASSERNQNRRPTFRSR